MQSAAAGTEKVCGASMCGSFVTGANASRYGGKEKTEEKKLSG